jgi:hypothetical protein
MIMIVVVLILESLIGINFDFHAFFIEVGCSLLIALLRGRSSFLFCAFNSSKSIFLIVNLLATRRSLWLFRIVSGGCSEFGRRNTTGSGIKEVFLGEVVNVVEERTESVTGISIRPETPCEPNRTYCVVSSSSRKMRS